MDEAQFQDLVDRHGEDLALWPMAARAGAEALLRHSGTARAILERAVALRTALADQQKVSAPSGLKARIVALADDDGADKPLSPEARTSRLRAGS